MAQKGTPIDDVKSNGGDKPRISDKVTLFKFPEKKWVVVRVFGNTYSYSTGWIKTKKKDGKLIKFPVDMPSYDPETQQYDSTKYDPWYALWQSEKDVDREEQHVQLGVKYYVNAIFRRAQTQEPSKLPKATPGERKSGFKEKDSDTWTPVVALALPKSAMTKIKELSGLNVVESKKSGNSRAYAVSDERYGQDIKILYDSTKSPAEQYQVNGTDSRTPLTEEELAYLTWDLSDLSTTAKDADIKADYENWANRMGIKTAKKRKHEVEELENDDLPEDEDEDEDEDDTPKRKKAVKKAPAKGKKKVVEEDDDFDEDEDEEEDDDEDEDEDDDPPARKKKAPAKKTVAKGKKKVVEEDEDEDDFGDDDDDDDDPPPRKKAAAKKPVKGKKKAVEEDEDGDDEDEDEDDFGDDDDDDADEDGDEDDDPSVRKKAPAKKVAAKGKKKAVEEDDDEEEDDDFDEDEDEDDDPPPRKKKVPAKKTAKRR